MGGVNLSEESKNILAAVPETSGQLRSCRDDILLSHTPLASKIRKLGTQLIHSVKYKVVDFIVMKWISIHFWCSSSRKFRSNYQFCMQKT